MWNLFEPLFKKDLKKNTSSQIDSDPLRAELFSGDHLAHHATEIAQLYHIEKRIGVDLLLPRLAANESVLYDTQELLNQVIEDNRRIAPAGEWLLDNFYLIEEQIRTARRHLPEGYSRELPHLVNGPFEGYPRVYHLARELIAHSDGRIDNENLVRFIEAYQRVSPLLLGELWAVPIMFRLSLLENLRRIADILSANTRDSDLAGYWVERMMNIAREDPSSLILVIADMARSDPVMTSAFVAEISRQLHGQSGILTFPLSWIEQRLSENNLTIELMVTAENHAQAVDQVSIGNSIGSLRLLDKMDWREFVERLSHVEQILSKDPTDEYGSMDFETRDRYRHVVEEIAKKGGISESEVASQAVRIAQECRERAEKNPREWHVGYYLIDEGRNILEDHLSVTSSLFDQIKKRAFEYLFPEYLCGIAGIILLVILYGYFHLSSYGLFISLSLTILLLFPVSQGAIALMNWFIPLILNPVSLPKMDYSTGIPDDRRTIVVIPTVLSCTGDVACLLDSIEIRYLANRDNNLYFAFLTDLRNASQQEMPDDDEVVNLLAT